MGQRMTQIKLLLVCNSFNYCTRCESQKKSHKNNCLAYHKYVALEKTGLAVLESTKRHKSGLLGKLKEFPAIKN